VGKRKKKVFQDRSEHDPRVLSFFVRTDEPKKDGKNQYVVHNYMVGVIRAYRAVITKIASSYALVHSAAGDISPAGKMKMNNEKVKTILSLCLENTPNNCGPAYELKTLVKKYMPTWKSHLVEACARDINTFWTSADPLLKIPKGALVACGSRNPPEFKNIGVPMIYCHSRKDGAELEGLRIRLNFDNDEGAPAVVLKPASKLDWYRYSKLRAIVEGSLEVGSIRINEYGGKLKIFFSYWEPKRRGNELDPQRCLDVSITNDPMKFFKMQIALESRKGTVDEKRTSYVQVFAAMDKADETSGLDHKYRQLASSSRRTGPGKWHICQRYKDKRTAVSKNRDGVTKYWNSVWGNMIVKQALSWGCGKIKVALPKEYSYVDSEGHNRIFKPGLADSPGQERSWPWFIFKNGLIAKASNRYCQQPDGTKGIAVEFVEVTPEEVVKEIQAEPAAKQLVSVS
jgi:hypothetical protein